MYTDTITDTAFLLNNNIIEGPSFQYRNIKNGRCDENIVFEKGTPRIQKKINGTLFSLLTGGAGNSNYWHWIFDVLPRIAIVNKKINLETIDYFLLPDLKKKFQKETLNNLNIPENKRLSSKIYRHIFADKIICVDHPYVLNNDPSNDIQNIPEWITQWLRKKFLNNLKENKNLPKKFYIERSDSTSNLSNFRKITNENSILEILKKNNYEKITLGNLDFLDQVNLFKNAEKIVGLHGAGFANLVFCSPQTKVLELKSITAGNVIKNLAIKNKLVYDQISVKPVKFENYNQFGHIEIPLDLLREKIV